MFAQTTEDEWRLKGWSLGHGDAPAASRWILILQPPRLGADGDRVALPSHALLGAGAYLKANLDAKIGQLSPSR